jgi:hypothetical protein
VALAPDYLEACTHLARLELKAGRPDMALDLALRAGAQDPLRVGLARLQHKCAERIGLLHVA